MSLQNKLRLMVMKHSLLVRNLQLRNSLMVKWKLIRSKFRCQFLLRRPQYRLMGIQFQEIEKDRGNDNQNDDKHASIVGILTLLSRGVLWKVPCNVSFDLGITQPSSSAVCICQFAFHVKEVLLGVYLPARHEFQNIESYNGPMGFSSLSGSVLGGSLQALQFQVWYQLLLRLIYNYNTGIWINLKALSGILFEPGGLANNDQVTAYGDSAVIGVDHHIWESAAREFCSSLVYAYRGVPGPPIFGGYIYSVDNIDLIAVTLLSFLVGTLEATIILWKASRHLIPFPRRRRDGLNGVLLDCYGVSDSAVSTNSQHLHGTLNGFAASEKLKDRHSNLVAVHRSDVATTLLIMAYIIAFLLALDHIQTSTPGLMAGDVLLFYFPKMVVSYFGQSHWTIPSCIVVYCQFRYILPNYKYVLSYRGDNKVFVEKGWSRPTKESVVEIQEGDTVVSLHFQDTPSVMYQNVNRVSANVHLLTPLMGMGMQWIDVAPSHCSLDSENAIKGNLVLQFKKTERYSICWTLPSLKIEHSFLGYVCQNSKWSIEGFLDHASLCIHTQRFGSFSQVGCSSFVPTVYLVIFFGVLTTSVRDIQSEPLTGQKRVDVWFKIKYSYATIHICIWDSSNVYSSGICYRGRCQITVGELSHLLWQIVWGTVFSYISVTSTYFCSVQFMRSNCAVILTIPTAAVTFPVREGVLLERSDCLQGYGSLSYSCIEGKAHKPGDTNEVLWSFDPGIHGTYGIAQGYWNSRNSSTVTWSFHPGEHSTQDARQNYSSSTLWVWDPGLVISQRQRDGYSLISIVCFYLSIVYSRKSRASSDTSAVTSASV